MIKTTLLALVAAASVASFAAPAFADAGSAFGDGSEDSREFAEDTILTRLQQQGVRATSVEEWGTLVRAFVIHEDGTQGMQLFTAGSLTPING